MASNSSTSNSCTQRTAKSSRLARNGWQGFHPGFLHSTNKKTSSTAMRQAFFYYGMARSSLVTSGEQRPPGPKKAKNRLTVLDIVNMDDTEKKKLLVIVTHSCLRDFPWFPWEVPGFSVASILSVLSEPMKEVNDDWHPLRRDPASVEPASKTATSFWLWIMPYVT